MKNTISFTYTFSDKSRPLFNIPFHLLLMSKAYLQRSLLYEGTINFSGFLLNETLPLLSKWQNRCRGDSVASLIESHRAFNTNVHAVKFALSRATNCELYHAHYNSWSIP